VFHRDTTWTMSYFDNICEMEKNLSRASCKKNLCSHVAQTVKKKATYVVLRNQFSFFIS
jgi:hypothetical protein